MNNVPSDNDFDSVSSGFIEHDARESDLEPKVLDVIASGNSQVTYSEFGQELPVWFANLHPKVCTFSVSYLDFQGNVKNLYAIGETGKSNYLKDTDEGGFTTGCEGVVA